MECGVFTYVAHPDMINFIGDESLYEKEMTRLCLASKKNNIPLEINLHGIHHKRHYPSDRFFAIAGKVGAPVTFGVDAHESSALLYKDTVYTASKMVEKHKLNYIGMPKLRSII